MIVKKGLRKYIITAYLRGIEGLFSALFIHLSFARISEDWIFIDLIPILKLNSPFVSSLIYSITKSLFSLFAISIASKITSNKSWPSEVTK